MAQHNAKVENSNGWPRRPKEFPLLMTPTEAAQFLRLDQTTQLLADLQVQSEEGHPYIFISAQRLQRILCRREIGNWSPTSEVVNNLARDFGVVRQRAGVEKCTLHDLRRSAITNWAQKLPIQVVQQLAGHSDITTTRKYYPSVHAARHRIVPTPTF